MSRFCKVYKKNIQGDIIHIYNSCKECAEDIGVCTGTLTSYIKKKTIINNSFILEKEIKTPYMQDVKCDNCGKVFKCQKFRIKDRQNLFCCTKCMGEYRKKQTSLNAICPICGILFHVEKAYKEKTKNENCCSYKCCYIYRETLYKGEGNHQYGLKGSLNSSWKSDTMISTYGYRAIRKLDHPFRNSSDFVFEHRLIAEQYLLDDDNSCVINGKKYLKKDYEVHHINFDKLDNKVDNLIVLTKSEHMSIHSSVRAKSGYLEEYCNKYNLKEEDILAQIEYNKRYSRKKSTADEKEITAERKGGIGSTGR